MKIWIVWLNIRDNEYRIYQAAFDDEFTAHIFRDEFIKRFGYSHEDVEITKTEVYSSVAVAFNDVY